MTSSMLYNVATLKQSAPLLACHYAAWQTGIIGLGAILQSLHLSPSIDHLVWAVGVELPRSNERGWIP